MDERNVSAKREAELQQDLVREISELALEFARQFTTPEEEEDLAHDVVLECLRMIEEGRWPRAVKALPGLINRIVARRARDRRARRRSAARRDADHRRDLYRRANVRLTPHMEAEEAEVIAACEAALGHVSRAGRAIYRAVRVQGYSIRAAAKQLKLTRAAAASLLRHADRAIRTELLALGLLPESTSASEAMMLQARAGVGAVRRRRRQEMKRKRGGWQGGIAPHRWIPRPRPTE